MNSQDPYEGFLAREYIQNKLQKNNSINIDDIANELNLTKDKPEAQAALKLSLSRYCEEHFAIDDDYLEEYNKSIHLIMGKNLEIIIKEDILSDDSIFKIQNNHNGTVDIILKGVTECVKK